jgi:putative transposase
MTVYKLDKGAHSVYTLHYHLILVVKYRRKALYNEVIRERLKQVIYEMAEKWKREKNTEMAIEIVAQEPGEDHHHILFKAAPNTALTKVINSIKGASARVLRNEFPDTKKILWGDAFWAPSYLLATTGQVSLDVLKAYVESQESKREKICGKLK